MAIDIEPRELHNISSRHFPDKSTRWLFQEKENIRGLLEIIASELVELLDFTQLKQLNRSFISDELRAQESDMVFSIPFRDPTETQDELIIYILLEHQSTVDPAMGFRLLFYMCQLWDTQRREWETAQVPKGEWRLPPIVPIVFYTGSQAWKLPVSLTTLMDVPDILSRFVPTFETLFLSVKNTAPEHLTRTSHPLGWLLTVLRQEDADAVRMREALLEALSGLTGLDSEDAAQYRRAILYLFHLILHRRAAEEHQDLLHLLVSENVQNMEVVNMAQSIIELSEQRGLEQGIEQGIEQGTRETTIQNIVSVLTARFPENAEHSVAEGLRAIQSMDRLQLLLRIAAQAPSFETFLERLDT